MVSVSVVCGSFGVVGWCMVYGAWSYSATNGYNGSYKRFYAFRVLGIG